MFYEVLRLCGGPITNGLKNPGGSAKEKTLTCVGGVGWEARSVVFYEGLRLWGGSGSNQPVRPGGSAKENPSRAWGI